jgi:hypothetical protein
MKPAATLALALVLCAMPVAAQDPLITIPEAYQVQFENAWVKVVRVHYAAGAMLPVHTHPPGTTAYLYLNDSEGVVFRHESGSSRAVTRPAVKAGSMRVATGPSETHNAENPAATPSDFVKVHFKTASDGPRNLRRRIPAHAGATTSVAIKEEFLNAQMRITRLIIPPGQSAEIHTTDTQPALLLAVSTAALTGARGSSMDLRLAPGQEHWVEPRQRERVSNTSAASVELIRIDFLTTPVN